MELKIELAEEGNCLLLKYHWLKSMQGGGGGVQPSLLGCDILFLGCKLEQIPRVVRGGGCNKWERGLNNETKPNTLEFQF